MSHGRRNTGTSSSSHKAIALFALLLFGRKAYSLKQLAEQLECSRQTIMRLIDEIELVGGFSVRKWKEDCQNWYRLAAPEGKMNVCLSRSELRQLVACRDFIRHLLPAAQELDLKNAVSKAACFTEGKDLPLVQVGSASPKGQIDYDPFDGIIRALVNAQADLQVVEINYQARLNPEGPRVHCFVPVRLVSFHDGLYVRGWSVNEKGKVEIVRPMTLAVHRMKSLTATRRNLSEKDHRKGNFPEESGYFGMANQNKPFEVKARFYPPAVTYVKERRWSAKQSINEHKDGSVELTFIAQSEYEVVKWILSFGQEARLIYPIQLRTEIKCILQNSLSFY